MTDIPAEQKMSGRVVYALTNTLALLSLFPLSSPFVVAPLGSTALHGLRCSASCSSAHHNSIKYLPLELAGRRPRDIVSLRTANRHTGTAEREEQDENEMEEMEDNCLDEFVYVHDPSNSKKIMCFVDQAVNVGGMDYKLGYPVDTPVVLAYFDDNDDLVPATDAQSREMMHEAETALAHKGCDLIDSAVVLTVRGELDAEEEDVEGLIQEARLDEEYVRVLTPFEHEEQECYVVEPMEPVVIVFTLTTRGTINGKFVQEGLLVSPEELLELMPHFEKDLSARFEKEL